MLTHRIVSQRMSRPVTQKEPQNGPRRPLPGLHFAVSISVSSPLVLAVPSRRPDAKLRGVSQWQPMHPEAGNLQMTDDG